MSPGTSEGSSAGPRVFVDTSVWVAFLRGSSESIRRELSSLLDRDRAALAAPVRVELLGGVSREQAPQLARLLEALPTYLPTELTWRTMESWAMSAGKRGQPFGVGDLLVAAIAHEQHGLTWSLDGDFRRLRAQVGIGVYGK